MGGVSVYLDTDGGPRVSRRRVTDEPLEGGPSQGLLPRALRRFRGGGRPTLAKAPTALKAPQDGISKRAICDPNPSAPSQM